MLDRRQFLGSSAAAGLVSLASTGRVRADAADRGRLDTNHHDSRLIGWETPPSDHMDCPQLVIENRIPDGLRGIFRRNGPAGHDRFGMRYNHWFDGDGMIQEFRFDDRGVRHRGRMMRTPKLSKEDAAGRRLYPTMATHVPDPAPVRRPDDMNTANTSLLDFQGELLALWEGGSPSLVDPESLSWKAFKSWSSRLKGVPFTAHPKVEADGTLWAFGSVIGPKPMIVLYHIAANGRVVKAAAVPVAPMGMVHDFVVTDRHLILVIPPFVHEQGQGPTFLDSHAWRPEIGSRVLIVSKSDFGVRRWVQLEAGFGFHHGNGWEEADGTLRFDYCPAPDSSLVEVTMRDVMNGKITFGGTPRYTRVALHPDGRTVVEDSGRPAEFPRIAEQLTGRRNRFVYMLGSAGHPDWLLRTVMKKDLERDVTDLFDYGKGIIAEEHIFVPFPDGRAEDDGWLLGTFLAHEMGKTGVAVFDARRISDGPVARAWLPYPLPLGFHGQFSAT